MNVVDRHIFPATRALKRNSVTLVASIAAIFVVLTTASSIGVTIVNAQKTSPPPDHYIVQKTAESGVDPLPGHQGHHRNYISWTASYPVEMVILHKYASASGNATFGKPLTAPFGKGEVAISLVKNPSGTPIPSGSLDFVGNAVAFHTLDGHKFTVTYTADARAEDLSKTSK